MGIPLFPATVLALTLMAVFAIRSQSTSIRLLAEAVLLVVIGISLWARGTTLVPTDAFLRHTPEAPWLRAMAVIWWLIAARVTAIIVVVALGRDARSRHARLLSDLLAGAVYLTALVIILNSVLDLPLRGLLATSGVIAIVFGLALQNTLSDVFSGIAVGLEQPFHVGDRVQIDDHAEGVIVEVNWRSIRIQTDADDLATIPNSIVARSRIVNHSVPTARRAVTAEIPTLSSVRSETLLNLAHQAVMLCPDILRQPTPSVFLKHLGVRTTTIGISYSVADTSMLTSARGQLLRQVRRLFRHAGVHEGQALTYDGLLQGVMFFDSLSNAQLETLKAALILHRYDAGATLFEQGSVGASLFIIRAGIFEASRRELDGSETALGRIGPGEYLGEISMMTGDPRQISVVALTAGDVLELPRSAIEELLRDDDALSVALERSVKRGLALLDRDDAARNSHPFDTGESLLHRMRIFLRLRMP